MNGEHCPAHADACTAAPPGAALAGTVPAPAPALGGGALAAYSALALPLAMAALPVYLFAPPLYAAQGGLSLASVGAVLLAVRVLAALADPLLGWWAAHGRRGYAGCMALALLPLLAGYPALFHPPSWSGNLLLAWFAAALALVHVGYGFAVIVHQSWGAALASAPSRRVRLTSAREACALAGAVLAALLGGWLGHGALSWIFAATLLASAWLLLRRAPAPAACLPCGAARADAALGQSTPARLTWRELCAPFADARFRAIFGVLALSSLAGAVPATLFAFYAADRLVLPGWGGPLLALYLVCAAAGMPLWAWLARRHGEARAWLGAMLLSAISFVWAFTLGVGDGIAFAAICIISGVAGGADLALPPALLAAVAAAARKGPRSEAPYFAWWNWSTQLALALAAGVVLPALSAFGYQPGVRDGTTALAAAYALLPCLLKLVAALVLWRASPALAGLDERNQA